MPLPVEIINLVDNHITKPGLLAEHGLSFLIRAGSQSILFDTGSPTAVVIVNNMRALSISPKEITSVILSHGHYDHAGGLKRISELTGPLPVYAHPGIFEKKYKKIEDREPQYIGIPWSQEELEEKGIEFRLSRKAVKLSEDIILTGEVPRRHSFEEERQGFLIIKNGISTLDTVLDDQSLVINTVQGLVVVLGCCHAGIINTLEYVLDMTGASRIFAVIGGTHLKDASPERVQKTVNLLPRFGIQHIIGCHCTGFEAAVALHKALNEKFLYNAVGNVFKVA